METTTSILNHLKEIKERRRDLQKPKIESPLKKDWADIKATAEKLKKQERARAYYLKNRERIKEKARNNYYRKREEREKLKAQLEKPSPDEEAEEIKKELDEKVSDERILKKRSTERKASEKPEALKNKNSYTTFLIYGLISLVAIGLVLGFLSRKKSSQISQSSEFPKPKTRKFDIGGGKIIDVPV